MTIFVNGNMEKAIAILRKDVERSGILRELKLRKHFLSRTERRKEKDHLAKRRLLKRLRRREEQEKYLKGR